MEKIEKKKTEKKKTKKKNKPNEKIEGEGDKQK